MEKHLLREAFKGMNLIPDEILWRRKEAFSDGLSSMKKSWYASLQEHIESEVMYMHMTQWFEAFSSLSFSWIFFFPFQVNDSQLEKSVDLYPLNPPKTKEGFFMRQIFEKNFPGRSEWTPYYWMPRWIKATDPSARTLSIYKPDKDE